jgi:hypothetical protein
MLNSSKQFVADAPLIAEQNRSLSFNPQQFAGQIIETFVPGRIAAIRTTIAIFGQGRKTMTVTSCQILADLSALRIGFAPGFFQVGCFTR